VEVLLHVDGLGFNLIQKRKNKKEKSEAER